MNVCANCRHLAEVALHEYTGHTDKRCGRWRNTRGRWSDRVAWRDQDVCEQWAALSEADLLVQQAYLALSYTEWLALQRQSLIFVHTEGGISR